MLLKIMIHEAWNLVGIMIHEAWNLVGMIRIMYTFKILRALHTIFSFALVCHKSG